jgi:RING-variant domain
MSSLPQSSAGGNPSEQDQAAQSPSSPTMASEDSDTVLLNDPSSAKSKHNPNSQSTTTRPRPPSRSSTLGIKKCWICICDSTEDDQTHPPAWRSPCTCSLQAHEACLLDWVADLENPKNRKGQTPPAKILCPQCKGEIKIARPKSYVVEGVRAVDRAFGRLVLPGIGFSLFGTIWAGAWIHGFQSVYVVFGPQHAQYIFYQALTHRGWLFGYPLIPLSLIFSRTNYADFVLPGGTLFLLATQLTDHFEIDYTIWPPLPSTVFACLPALRTSYNWCYERAFGELNRRWIEEVQPRQNERAEGQEDNFADIANPEEAAAEEAAGEHGMMQIELEINIGPEADGLEEADDAVNAAPAANQNGNAGVHQILGQRGDEFVEGTSSLGQSVLGALVFPVVSAGFGGLLSYVIPSSWMTNSNWMNGRPGLLRHRWGRSVVGGCLFIVLKDALVLYCRWKLAQGHRQRKIMDYDKKTKQYKLTSS